ncbi:MAG: efflux RND transporter permease subunit [Planctomycetota bacterium]
MVRFAFYHRRALFVLLALLIAAGVRAGFLSSRSIYPEVAFPRIAVIAESGEAPVRGMLIAVTRPIEQAVSAVPKLKRVRSKTLRGASEFSLDFESGTDMREALALVRARVAQAGLPSDLAVTIEQQTPAVFPVLSFNVTPGPEIASNPVERARLSEWVNLELKPRLARLPDAFFVTAQSGDQREFVLEADEVALAQAGLELNDITAALGESNQILAVGRMPAEGLQYQLLVDGELTDPQRILDLVVVGASGSPIALGQLGRLVETTAERTQIVTGGQVDSVVVSVFLRDGGRVTDLSKDVRAILEEMHGQLPGASSVTMVYDQAELVQASIHGVRDAIAIGALLSVLVLALFLGEWRVTLVAGLAIPLSVVLTLALFPLLHESLNLMSLGGLAVAIGLMIDDAIVVVENVARRMAPLPEGAGPGQIFSAVSEGVREVLGAIVGSSLTTVVVFLPLVLLEGVVGQFFQSLAMALGLSILASMAVSLVWSPLLLLTNVLRPRSGGKSRRWMEWLQKHYAGLLSGLSQHAGLTLTGLTAVLLAMVAGLGNLQTGFLPEMDEGGFVLDYTLPVGSSLMETDAACRQIEAILGETAEVNSFSRRTGAELGFFATEQFTGDILVGLVPHGSRTRSVFEVIDELRLRMAAEVPQAECEFIQVMQDTIADLAGNPDPIEVKLFGPDYRQLQAAADTVAAAIEATPGLVDLMNHVSFGSPELVWRPKPLRLAQAGLSTAGMADQISTQLLGTVATRIRQGDQYIDVRVRGTKGKRMEAVTDTPGPELFLTPAGGASAQTRVPIQSLASFDRQIAENELERENQVPMVRVTAGVAGSDLGTVSRAVELALGKLNLGEHVRYEMGGQALSQRSAFRNLVSVFAMGAGLVFLLLVVQFRSLRLPAIIFLALPFGQIGGLLALRASGIALNISSGMGLIMLVGLVVKNGIIMIEYAQQLCSEGSSEHEAMIEAARIRLRPVLMTTLAAIAGLLPLALGIGEGAELQKPLAVVVIGGLLISTLCSLVVVPIGCLSLGKGALLPEGGRYEQA